MGIGIIKFIKDKNIKNYSVNSFELKLSKILNIYLVKLLFLK